MYLRDIPRAYRLLHDRLTLRGTVGLSRKIAPYIRAFPGGYARLILEEGYAPDLQRLIRDYLRHNPTRNRPLDMLPLFAHLKKELGTVMVSLSGGEPLMRNDLQALAAAFDQRTCLTLNTTGYHLTPRRARSLRASGVFHYPTPEQVLEHLLKSGAGTAFHQAVDPASREALEQEFIQMLAARHPAALSFPVIHDYVACIASKSGTAPVAHPGAEG